MPWKKPGKLAPHVNDTLALMIGGQKPLAFIDAGFEKEDSSYGEALRSLISLAGEGKLASKKSRRRVGNEDYLYYLFAQPGEEWRIKVAENLLAKPLTDDGHIEFGRLLGYSDDDIKWFLEYNWFKSNTIFDEEDWKKTPKQLLDFYRHNDGVIAQRVRQLFEAKTSIQAAAAPQARRHASVQRRGSPKNSP